jgi:hypothetical protein
MGSPRNYIISLLCFNKLREQTGGKRLISRVSLLIKSKIITSGNPTPAAGLPDYSIFPNGSNPFAANSK